MRYLPALLAVAVAVAMLAFLVPVLFDVADALDAVARSVAVGAFGYAGNSADGVRLVTPTPED